ncbi:DUF4422 domain-containing protein [Pluralibacter gergoviae]|uniref:DUF4422 domain-containing protein n=1 Tax=Pluralibacter gergoviae TaxID=61647 RepID=UPI000651103B|nr:DUF4422 domain-containing protein [Pluralibacter gergoviae]KMK27381.1 hypothetical protein ABW10_02700 [Pluralibacter gergoviae]
MGSVDLYIVTHKDFDVPGDRLYKPIIVGNGDVKISSALRDNVGDNIAEKNKSFCEMTAIYWLWKNIPHEADDIIGLNHYRRYFSENKKNNIVNYNTVLELLSKYDVIIPKKRNYFLFSIESHYCKAHHENDLKKVRQILERKHAEYLPFYDSVMRGTKLSLYNMFITRWKLFSEYCEWLFPILFELDEQIDKKDYDPYQMRVIGFIAERLFNVWLEEKRTKIKIYEMSVYNTDGENLIHKGFNLLKRQIRS